MFILIFLQFTQEFKSPLIFLQQKADIFTFSTGASPSSLVPASSLAQPLPSQRASRPYLSLVGCYNGLKGASAAFAGASVALADLHLYLDPIAVFLMRGEGAAVAEHTDGKLIVRAVTLVLSIVVGTDTAKRSGVEVANMHRKMPGRLRGYLF